VYLTRSFIHIGPRQDARPAAQTFAVQIAQAEAGLRAPVIDAGNLQVKRDFLDVADAVRGLWALLERGQPGEAYNLCSGRAASIRELLDIYLALAERPMDVREDPSRLRPADEPILQGDNSKLRAATGWQPRVTLEESCQRILDYWRAQIARS
jgi:GDP-4-dehydro-6-deoxy-D-mannose reductase